MKRSQKRTWVIVLAMFLVVAPALPASAATVQHWSGTGANDVVRIWTPDATMKGGSNANTIWVPMTITGYDRDVASAHGYEIRTDSAGHEYSIRASAPPGGVLQTSAMVEGVSTQATSTVYGNCGSSFITLSAATDRAATGYSVYGATLWRQWGMTVVNGTVTHGYDLSGGITGASWSTYRTVSWAFGYTDAWVNSGSYVMMWDGGYCSSGLPSTGAWM